MSTEISAACANVSGTIFNDVNNNGMQDGGEPTVSGVIVNAYDSAEALFGNATSTGAGYTITGSSSVNLRLEFSSFPAGFYPSAYNGAASASATRFVSTSCTNINFGIYNPLAFTNPDPQIATAIFIGNAAAAEANVQSINFNVAANAYAPATPTFSLGNQGTLGNVWGLAWRKSKNELFASSVVTAPSDPWVAATSHSPNTNSCGAIHQIKVNTSNYNASTANQNWIELQGMTSPLGGTIDFSNGGSCDNSDANLMTAGIGDIDISNDEKSLFVTNMKDKKIYEVDIATKTVKSAWAVPQGDCTGGSGPASVSFQACGDVNVPSTCVAVNAPKEARPWGLAVNQNSGKLYVAATCTTRNQAYVYEIDPTLGSASPITNVLNNLTEGYSLGYNTVDLGNYHALYPGQQGVAAIYYVMDIEFDDTDNMLMSTAAGPLYGQMQQGEVWRAGKTGSTWSYNGRFANNGVDCVTSNGALAYKRGTGGTGLITTAMDPISQYSGGLTWFDTGSLAEIKSYQIVKSYPDTGAGCNGARSSRVAGTPVTSANHAFFKSTGLGDIEVLETAPSIQIGNRVWFDANRDGIQSADIAVEPGISGVTVQLWEKQPNNTFSQVDSTVTDGAGNYLFLGLSSTTDYEVRVTNGQLALGGKVLTPVSNPPSQVSDMGDNDAIPATGYSVIALTTGATGENNHNFDIGFALLPPMDLSIVKNHDSAAFPAPYYKGSTVRFNLHSKNNGPDPAKGAIFMVDNLPAGLTFVSATSATVGEWSCVNAGQLVTCTRTGADLNIGDITGNVIIDATVNNSAIYDTDLVNYAKVLPANDEVRLETNLLGTTNGGYETGDPTVGSNNDDSKSIQVTRRYAIGNKVWFDKNNNAMLDVGETVLPGVKMELLNNLGAVIDTQNTDTNGYYLFDKLMPGTYKVQVSKDNWATGGVLLGYRNSDTVFDSASVTSPATNTTELGKNNKDHAIDPVSYLSQIGSGVVSNDIILGLTLQPSVDDKDVGATGNGDHSIETDENDNLTIDFGFYKVFDLSITKVITSTTPYIPGYNVSYTLSGKNNGPATAKGNVSIVDQLPVGLTYVSATGTNWACSAAGQIVTCNRTGADIAMNGLTEDILLTVIIDTNVADGTLLRNYAKILPATAEDGIETNLLGTTNGGYETGDPTVGSNNDDSKEIRVARIYSIGNFVWQDANNNAMKDTIEPVIANVKLDLYNELNQKLYRLPDGLNTTTDSSLGTNITATTDINGYYRFDSLLMGSYKVRVTEANWQGTGVLIGYENSTGKVDSFPVYNSTTNTLELSRNNKDHGVDVAIATYPTNGVISDVIMVGTDLQPYSDDMDSGASGAGLHAADGDKTDNLTIDFGFFKKYDLTIKKEIFGGVDTFRINDTVKYILTGKNNGPAATLGNVRIVDQLPVGLTYVSATGTNWACSATGQIVTCNRTGADIANMTEVEPINVVTTVNTSITADIELTNYAKILPDAAEVALETNLLGTSNNGFETGDPMLASNNDDSKKIKVVRLYSVGNKVWLDTNNNGMLDVGELPLVGILVVINKPDGTQASAYTDVNGYYRFDNLVAGTYTIKVSSENWTGITANAGATPLVGFVSSTGVINSMVVTDAVTNTTELAKNNKDHGMDPVDYNAHRANGVVSANIILGATSQPTVDDKDMGATGSGDHSSELDSNDNLTIDFGFHTVFDLTVSKSIYEPKTKYFVGDQVKYSLIGKNNGPATAKGNISIIDKLPLGLTYVSAIGNGWTCTASGQLVTCNRVGADIQNQNTVDPIIVTTTIDSGIKGGTNLINLAKILPSNDEVAIETNVIGTDNEGFENGNSATNSNNDVGAVLGISYMPASLGDYVWIDTNKNGLQDQDELPLSKVKVELYKGDNNVLLGSMETDVNGKYLFSDLLPGSYYVKFHAPKDYNFTNQNMTPDDKDSDGDTINGQTQIYVLAEGEHNPTVDMGLYYQKVLEDTGADTNIYAILAGVLLILSAIGFVVYKSRKSVK